MNILHFMDQITRKFDHRVINPNPYIVALLAEIDEMKGQFRAGLRFPPKTLIRLRQSTLITSAGASTRIEGAKLTDEEVEKLMHGISFTKFAERDAQEVQGYLETLQIVFDGFQTMPLRESTILSLHSQLLKYSTKDELHRGEYKKKENTVGILNDEGKIVQILFETTKAYLAPKEMHELVNWTFEALDKNRFHPLLVIGNFIVEFLKIHPFEDGNGRLSRILTNLLLLRYDYSFTQYVSHDQIIEKRKDEYYMALRKSQETFTSNDPNIIPWLNFFLSVIKEQASKALTYLEMENKEDMLSPKQHGVWDYLSQVDSASPSQIVKETNIALGTVRQALDRLVELGMVKRIGQGRATRYIKLSQNIQKKS